MATYQEQLQMWRTISRLSFCQEAKVLELPFKYWDKYYLKISDETREKQSIEYIQDLIQYSKYSFNIRRYNEVEVALENAHLCLQGFECEEVQNELDDLNHEIKEAFMYFLAFSNPNEFENRLQDESSLIYLLHSSSDPTKITPEETFAYYHNMGARYFLMDETDLCISNSLKAISILGDVQYHSVEDLVSRPPPLNEYCLQSLLNICECLIQKKQKQDVKLANYQKIAWSILESINVEDSEIEYFDAKLNFLKAVICFDKLNYMEASRYIQEIIDNPTIAFYDFLKVKALTLKLFINKSTSKRSIETTIEKQIQQLEDTLSIPENSNDFHRFYTPLLDFFEVEFSDEEVEDDNS